MDQAESFLTVAGTARKYPAFTEPSLRWLAFNRKTNGFDGVFLKVGRKLLVDEKRFVSKIRSGEVA